MSGATDVVAAFAAAVHTKDADALGALFSDDAVFVNIMGTSMLGRQGIIDGHRWAFAGPLQHSTVALVEVTEVATTNDLSVVRALLRRGRVEGAPAEGLPPGDTLLLLTARRDGPRWLAIAAANVAVSNPPTTPTRATESGA